MALSDFQPVVRFLDSRPALLDLHDSQSIVFDSQLPDQYPRIVNIAANTDVVAAELRALVDYADDDQAKTRRFTVNVTYLQTLTNSAQVANALCSMEFVFFAEKHKGGLRYQDPADLEHLLNRRLAAAFMLALEMRLAPNGLVNSGSERVMQRYQSSQPAGGKRHWRNLATSAAIIGFIPLVIAMVWVTGKLTTPHDQLPLTALVADPNQINEQVEATKQVLKNMGLDPGRTGDLGCLAAKP